MAIVWQNSFDGVPGTNLTVANSSDWGNPIAGLRDDPPANSVRYGDRAYMGNSSMHLGTPAGSPHGNVWLYYPTGSEYSVSFYLYLPEGGWFRMRDANVVVEFYLATASQSYIGDAHPVPDSVRDAVFDRWVRIEISTLASRSAYRFYWTDPDSTGTPDYVYEHARDGGVIDGIFTQGAGDSGTTTPYLDQVRIGEGEWLGPWPEQHTTVALEGSMGMSGQLTAEGVEDDHTRLRGETHLSAPPVPASKHARVGLSAAIDLGAVTPVVAKASTVSLTGEVAQIEAPEVASSKASTVTLEGVMELDGDTETRSQFRATFPPRIITELMLDGEWVDVSSDVYVRDPVQITRGRADEAATADPSTCSLTLNNRHGRYSPHNPMSPYYGTLGKNTPLRVRVGPLPEDPDPEVIDTFDRTTTGGWGTTDTGQTWQGNTTGASTSGGAAHHTVAGINTGDTYHQWIADTGSTDVDITVSISIDQAPRGWSGGALYASVSPRVVDLTERVQAGVAFRVDMGSPQGLRVSTDFNVVEGNVYRQITGFNMVPGLAYQPGEWLRVRVQARGPEFRMRVWAEGTPEPDIWHSQAHLEDGPDGTGLGLRSNIISNAYATPLPTTVSYRDLRATPIIDNNLNEVSRFVGEVSEWPSRWDVSDTDVWVPVTASGILRRLGQGSKPLRSPTRRVIESSYPIAYWPMEDGDRTREAISPVPGVSPLRTVGFRYGEATDLDTSGALPELGPNASISAQSIPSVPTATGWTVEFLYRVDLPNDGFSDRQEFFSVQTTTNTYRFILDMNVTRPILRREVTDGDGNLMVEAFTNLDTVPTNPFFSEWKQFRVRARQLSTNLVEARFDWINTDDEDTGITYTFPGDVGWVSGVTTTFGTELEGMAIGHLTIVGAPNQVALNNPFAGGDGESARERMVRTSAVAGVPITITGQAREALGVEQVATYLEVMEEAQAADFGASGESRSHLGLTYTGRDQLYHATPALVLDYANGEISPPVEPTDDDQALRNDVEVKRRDGSAAQVEDTSGPLGVERVGRYDESVTLNLGTDRQAENHAGWRVHLGTVDELRWPVIRLNLANPRLSARVEDVLGLDVGDRIRILNPPPWTQAEHLDLIVQGYEETLNLFQWDIVLTCTPASPWNVGRMGDDDAAQVGPSEPSRADTAGSVLVAGIGAQATEFEVETVRGPNWVSTASNPDSLPFDITLGGEIMEVTDIQSDSQVQTFTVVRSVNGVVKPHGAGDSLSLANPAVTAL